MTHESPSQVLWLGAVTRPGQRRRVPVRVFTSGGAPGPEDRVEQIPDPFEAARLDAGAAQGALVADLARSMDPVRGGLAGPLGDFELAVPVRPAKILCVGRNYRAHAAEMGNEVPAEPLLFTKPSSALVASDKPIVRPSGYERVDMEAEVVAVIGGTGRNLDRETASRIVVGYTLGNDVSNRDLQRADKQWTRAKGFDTFAPLGPWVRVVEPSRSLPPEARIQGWVDDELRQDAAIADMVFDVPTVLAHASACMTLEPGDVIYTGTPHGVFPLTPGQRVEVRLQGFDLGVLRNFVVAGSSAGD